MSRGRVLAVDDEKNIRHLLVRELAVEGFDVHTAKTGEEGLKLLREHHFQVLLLDIKLPKMNGIEVLRNVKHVSPLTKVIMITGYGDIQTAVESMKLGARDYITKPFKLSELVALINQAIVEDWPGQDAAPGMSGIVLDGDVPFVACPSGPMQQVYDLVRKVAPTDATVLIQGETGVGKDVIAALIHGSSHRKDKPFIVVDCGLLNQNLAESELYGHGKGAFSGASELKQGLVERS
ncbi:MAG: sigma-54-dependent Fis family transcriptional regulator, partial [Deltaproteobacteria bacterium]|nr:sigma-54-dependent Fis family transcriptional regulator [Deltaproteobacteria bacterium]